MSYRPARVSPEQWAIVRPFVIECVLQFGASSSQVALNMASTATHFVVWGVFEKHAPLAKDDLFYPAMIRRWVNGIAATPNSKRTYESRLFQMAQVFGGHPRRTRSPHSPGSVAEYSERELAEIDSWAATRKTSAHRRDATLLIGLAGGAGARVRELTSTSIRRTDIRRVSDGIVVHIRGDRPRAVHVTDDWQQYFDQVLDEPDTNRRAIFPATNTVKSAESALQALTAGPHPAASPTRLRDTFVLRVLRETPVLEAMHLAGYAHAVSLNRFLPSLASSTRNSSRTDDEH